MARGSRPALAALAAVAACAVALPSLALGDDVPVTENASVGDAVTVLGPVSITVSENVGASDTVRVVPPVSISTAETLSAVDAVNVVPPALITALEGVHPSDAAAVVPPATVSASESVQATDGAFVLGPAVVTAGEAIQATDDPTASVVNTAPTVAPISDGSASEGSQFAAQGAFADPDPQSWTASVDYGDGGGPVPLQLSPAKTFLLSHVFDDSGTFAVTVAITDGNGASGTTTFQVDVSNVAPTGRISNNGPSAEGADTAITVLDVVDPSHADTTAGFTYAFDCGSGYGSPGSTATGTCRFDDNGTFTVKAKVADKDGDSTELTTSVKVTNVAPTATLENSGPANEGSPVAISFSGATDPSGADTSAGFHYAFSCQGGALTADYATAGADPGTTCTFTDNGTYAVTGRILDKDGGATDYVTSVTVQNVAPTGDLGNNGPVDEASPATIAFTNVHDDSPDDEAAGLRYRFDCGTGYGPESTTPSTTCTWDDGPSMHVVHATVRDKDGGATERTTQVDVHNVAPTVALTAPEHSPEGSAFTLGVNGPRDVSATDTAAGFTYAFDCGDGAGFGPFGTATSASCATVDNGTRSAGVRIQDKDGGASEARGTVVVDNVAPTATLVVPAAPVDEGAMFAVSLTSPADVSSADAAARFTYRFDCGTGYGVPTPIPAATCTATENPGALVKASIGDKDGGTTEYTATVPVVNLAPAVTITAPVDGSGFAVGTAVSFAGSFVDPGVTDTHTAGWTFDALTAPGVVTEAAGRGTATTVYTFARAGVYTVTLTVRDDDGAAGTATETIAVYDANDGFVTGGGWQGSGNAKNHFNVNAKYLRGAVSGAFDFRTDAWTFNADSFQWLVVAAPSAQLRGSGTIGTSRYSFLATITDGSPDRFRLKLWSPSTGAVLFDTVPGGRDDLDDAAPAPVDGGNLTVH